MFCAQRYRRVLISCIQTLNLNSIPVRLALLRLGYPHLESLRADGSAIQASLDALFVREK